MEQYFYLIGILLLLGEIIFGYGMIKVVAKEWYCYKQREELEMQGAKGLDEFEYCSPTILYYVFISFFIHIAIFFFNIICTPFSFVFDASVFIIGGIIFIFYLGDSDKGKRLLVLGRLCFDTLSVAIILLSIHIGLTNGIYGWANETMESRTYVATMPILQITENYHKNDVTYRPHHSPVRPVFSSDTPLKSEISAPNKLFLDVLPYLSIYSFHECTPEFSARSFSEPIEGNYVRLTIKEGYYGLNYLEQTEVILGD